jgi:hypothetical protein
MAKIIYRIGPIMVLAFVIVFSYAWGEATSPDRENQSAWYFGPMLGCLVLVPLWHFALIVTEDGRRIATERMLLFICRFLYTVAL